VVHCLIVSPTLNIPPRALVPLCETNLLLSSLGLIVGRSPLHSYATR